MNDDMDNIILKTVGTAIYVIIVVLGLFGNTFILAVIIRNSKLHHPVYIFLANQSLSDLLFAILSVGDVVYLNMGTWNMGEAFCKIQGAVMQVNLIRILTVQEMLQIMDY